MHVVATNLILWIKILSRETLEEIRELSHSDLGLDHKIEMVNIVHFEIIVFYFWWKTLHFCY